MYRRLDEEKIAEILEVGIEEFATHGLDRANVNVIARKAQVSVGVLYKYYGDKDSFFLACVRHSLELLREVLEEAVGENTDVRECISKIVSALLKHGKTHANYYVMYNEITSGSCKKYATVLAEEIEKMSAQAYTRLLENGKKQGKIRQDLDPGFFAFFFDNLLMMLQFSYSCEYYKRRYEIFCPKAENRDEIMAAQFIKFMSGALGLEKK